VSEIRLQKFLSEQGIASRREAERLILQGWVRVNEGVVRELGTKIDPQVDQVLFRGKILKPEKKYLYYLLHKPKNVIVTRKDPQNRKTVYELIPNLHASVRSVGRLDYDSEGLLLLTNEGELAFRLTHPSYEIKKVYEMQLTQAPSLDQMKKLEKGIILEGKKTAPCKIQKLNKAFCYSIQIHEGKKRQVRRMFEWAGCKALRLIRVKLGSLELGNLSLGKWRELTQEEVLKLRREVKM